MLPCLLYLSSDGAASHVYRFASTHIPRIGEEVWVPSDPPACYCVERIRYTLGPLMQVGVELHSIQQVELWGVVVED